MKGNGKGASNSKLRYGIFVFVAVVFFLYYAFRDTQSSNILLHETRFVPKVIPDNLDETAISLLPPSAFSNLVVIDAGSSGCRAHVFKYGTLGRVGGPTYVLPEHSSLKVKPGLSSFAETPHLAGESLKGLIDFVKTKVDQSEWSNTPIWLKATAGLRLLPVETSELILKSVRDYLSDPSNCPFHFRPFHAKIISGQEEGAMGWLAVNYLLKFVGPFSTSDPNNRPYAVVEMGGASTQVTQAALTAQEVKSIHPDYRYTFEIDNKEYTLYTHSYLGYGGDQAREALNNHLENTLTKPNDPSNTITMTLKDPCLNPGYFREQGSKRNDVYEGPDGPFHIIGGAENAGESCHIITELALFEKRHTGNMHEVTESELAKGVKELKGNNPHGCQEVHEPFSFNCIHQPNFVKYSPNFLVFENFFYAASGTGTLPVVTDGDKKEDVVASVEVNDKGMKSIFPLRTSPGEFAESANEVCSIPWEKMQFMYPRDTQPKTQNSKWCFIVSYAYLFLTHGLGLHDHQTITVRQTVGNSDIEWAIGAAYKEACGLSVKSNLRKNVYEDASP